MKLRTISRTLIGAIVVICIGIAAYIGISPRASTAQPLLGTVIDTPAPNFELNNQAGQRVTLSGQQGHIVILTFVCTHCLGSDANTAREIRGAVQALGPEAQRVRVLMVSTDPRGDTRRSVRRWVRRFGLSNWDYLTGTHAKLSQVWAKYFIYVPSEQQRITHGPAHTTALYLIDSTGQERVILDDGRAADGITQDLNVLLDDHQWQPALTTLPEVGSVAPNFGLQNLAGKAVQLSSFRGKVVLINFWATWCGPCRAEMPLLERLYRRAAGQVVVLGVDQEESAGDVRSFVHSAGVTYPIVLDTDGTVAFRYQIIGTPTTYFVDRFGVIRQIVAASLQAKQLNADVKSLTHL
jgi:cytochrome oxidase Cu insertion factor (SCO1/SenC/PrrC family)